MTELQRRFFQRVGLPEMETVTFQDVSAIQRAMALSIPFENLDVLAGRSPRINRDNLTEKLLGRNRGGLCYDLNPMMYYFLQDCGFVVRLVLGSVFDRPTRQWRLENGHVATVLEHEGESYLVDVGFASFLALAPIPFNGDIVESQAGKFRVLEQATDRGTHILQMNLVSEPPEGAPLGWDTAYAFRLAAADEAGAELAQAMTLTNEMSPLNKGPIIVRMTQDGHISLTPESFTTMVNGEKIKVAVSPAQYTEILEDRFGLKENSL